MTSSSIGRTEFETTESQLVIRRTFAAPRERVYRAFTDADELERWFVPEGMTAEVHANELEPGGAMAITWTDGEHRIDNEGYYLEVVENERVVSGEEIEDGELRLTYEFRDVDDGTEVVITQEFPGSVPDGATEGWAGMLDTLDEFLEARSTHIDTDAYDLTIERTFEAPVEAVWRAWTVPEEAAAWWGPRGFTVPRCELDLRPGGRIRIDMAGPDGTVYPSEGVYEVVEEFERLMLLSWVPDGDDRLFEVRQTITFEEAEDGATLLTLEAEVISATDEARRYLEGMETGWRQSLDKLDAFLEVGA